TREDQSDAKRGLIATKYERFSQMLMETTGLGEQAIDPRGSRPNGVAGALSVNGPPHNWPESSSIPYAGLPKLLQSAQQALDRDYDEAKRFIVDAADLLDAEVHRRLATECPGHIRAGNRHLAPWQTRRVIEFVEENLGGRIRLEDLARPARLSPR